MFSSIYSASMTHRPDSENISREKSWRYRRYKVSFIYSFTMNNNIVGRNSAAVYKNDFDSWILKKMVLIQMSEMEIHVKQAWQEHTNVPKNSILSKAWQFVNPHFISQKQITSSVSTHGHFSLLLPNQFMPCLPQ